MLPLVYHLQIVTFEFAFTVIRNFVIAHHPDHARQVLLDHYMSTQPSYWSEHQELILNADVKFVATLVNNENIQACVLEL